MFLWPFIDGYDGIVIVTSIQKIYDQQIIYSRSVLRLISIKM